MGRRGILQTTHGDIQTPFFMPVGTAGAMRGVTHEELLSLGAEILLCNTYHLHLQPGEDVVAEAGGLHSFIGWNKPILTDSGGFQVFSLRKISDIGGGGVHFRSHLNGDPLFLGPEEAMHIQHKLGADIIMCFDQCPPSTAKRPEIEAAVERTLKWAAACKKWHEKLKNIKIAMNTKRTKSSSSSLPSLSSLSSYSLLFGIIQGGLERDLREKCTEELIAMGFDGYAVGGLAVGETEEEMFSMLDCVCPLIPEESPRYLMGIGRIEQMKTAVAKGVDMFDCVLPMREARHGTLHLTSGEKIRITTSSFLKDHSPIDPDSPSALSRRHKKSYLCHLLRANERLGETIACMQNMGVTLKMIRELRREIFVSSVTLPLSP